MTESAESPQAPAPDPDFETPLGDGEVWEVTVPSNPRWEPAHLKASHTELARQSHGLHGMVVRRVRVVPASGPEERDIEYLRMEESAFNALREAMHIATGEGWTHNFNPLEWVMVFYRASRPAVPASGERDVATQNARWEGGGRMWACGCVEMYHDKTAPVCGRCGAFRPERRALASPAAAPRERSESEWRKMGEMAASIENDITQRAHPPAPAGTPPTDEECAEDCSYCSGEACQKCGAGCWSNVSDCEHDFTERHEHADHSPAGTPREPTDAMRATLTPIINDAFKRVRSQLLDFRNTPLPDAQPFVDAILRVFAEQFASLPAVPDAGEVSADDARIVALVRAKPVCDCGRCAKCERYRVCIDIRDAAERTP